MKTLLAKGLTKGYFFKERAIKKVKRVLRNEEGQGFAEYGLLLVLIVVVMIALIVAFRDELEDIFTEITTELQTR